MILNIQYIFVYMKNNCCIIIKYKQVSQRLKKTHTRDLKEKILNSTGNNI